MNKISLALLSITSMFLMNVNANSSNYDSDYDSEQGSLQTYDDNTGYDDFADSEGFNEEQPSTTEENTEEFEALSENVNNNALGNSTFESDLDENLQSQSVEPAFDPQLASDEEGVSFPSSEEQLTENDENQESIDDSYGYDRNFSDDDNDPAGMPLDDLLDNSQNNELVEVY